MLRLATQVQARTQQPTALGGQSRQLLVRAHVEESSRASPRNARHSCGNPPGAPVARPGNWPGSRRVGLNMVQRKFPSGAGWTAAWVLAGLGAVGAAASQEAPFQIVWVVIGEASSADDNASAHAGRQLFMASDLVSKSLANIKVEQVDVTPVISELTLGKRMCLTQLNIRALGPGKRLIADAPLSIAVRQDHKPRLGLKRGKRDICLSPTAAGEYPVRLTSLLPARDGSTRGAQVFVRVSDPTESENSTAADVP